MPRIRIDNGLQLYYEIEGQGEAVVLIQGLDRDCYGMMAQRRALSSCYQVVAYDARGTGKSDTPQGPYTCTQMAGELDHMAPPSLCERQLVKAISGSRLVIIKGAAHALFDEKPNEVNREIMDFLSSVTK
jgi:pimeloyl-ACP methyl ester carboxylesterase